MFLQLNLTNFSMELRSHVPSCMIPTYFQGATQCHVSILFSQKTEGSREDCPHHYDLKANDHS